VKRDLASEKKSEITNEILAYLVDHPDSGDTLEGIVEWWLLERKIKRQTANVKEALTELVTKGWVLEDSGRDGRTHYRINQKKYKEIKAVLKQ
jgi:hypothetical protein